MTAIYDVEQAKRALKHANEVRVSVAAFKRETAKLPHHEAALKVIDVIENRHEDKLLGAVRIRHLLEVIPTIGESKARKLIFISQIRHGDKRLRDVSDRQRWLLISLLEREGWKR